MILRTQAFARAGLIGNPSDGYFGKTISLIVRNFSARVTLYESPRLVIVPEPRDGLQFLSRRALLDDIRQNGYYGGVRLIKAAIKAFSDYCERQDIPLDDRSFTMEYASDIPVRVGLAGSSAIVTAAMRALASFYGVDIPLARMPNLVLSAETDELKIGAGLQDRVIQAYEGVVYMDFDRSYMEEHGHGRYEPLEPSLLPPLFIAYHDSLAEGTEITHNDLRSRWNRGDADVVVAMEQFAHLAEQAAELIRQGRGREMGPLMNANFDLRASLLAISEGNQRLVQTGRDLGASDKFCGSGGAVVGLYDGDPERLEQLRAAYAAFGAHVIVPEVVGGRL